MTQTRYANFNALTVTGRIFNAEVVEGASGDFLSVSVISTATKDGEDLVYTFTNNNGLLSLFNSGNFCKGREVTITGHIAGIKTAYRAKDGTVKLLKKPQVRMTSVAVLDGGLGRMPKSEGSVESLGGMTVTVDEAPEFGDATTKDEAGVPLF